MQEKILIIIPTFNRKKYLNILLNNIRKQEISNEYEINIVVVVDGSTDGTLEMLDDLFPYVNIIRGNGTWWYTKCINEGFKFAGKMKPDFILILNDDIEFETSYIQSLLTSYLKIGYNSIIGSVTLSKSAPHKIVFSGIKDIKFLGNKLVRYHKAMSKMDSTNFEGIYKTKYLPGRGMLIPQKILNDLHSFDRKYIQYYSDIDFCLRALKKGYGCYVSWNSRLFTDTKMTSPGVSYKKATFFQLINSYFDRYSRNYLMSRIRFTSSHISKIWLPLSVALFLINSLKTCFLRID